MLRLFWYTDQINFPIIDKPENEKAKILFQLKRHLQEEKADDNKWVENIISFSGGIFRFVSNWNPLIFISKGEIEILEENHQIIVVFHLFLLQVLTVSTLTAAFLGLMILPFPLNSLIKILVIVGGWLWFVGLNYILAISRFHKLIHKAWTKAYQFDKNSYMAEWYK